MPSPQFKKQTGTFQEWLDGEAAGFVSGPGEDTDAIYSQHMSNQAGLAELHELRSNREEGRRAADDAETQGMLDHMLGRESSWLPARSAHGTDDWYDDGEPNVGEWCANVEEALAARERGGWLSNDHDG